MFDQFRPVTPLALYPLLAVTYIPRLEFPSCRISLCFSLDEVCAVQVAKFSMHGTVPQEHHANVLCGGSARQTPEVVRSDKSKFIDLVTALLPDATRSSRGELRHHRSTPSQT